MKKFKTTLRHLPWKKCTLSAAVGCIFLFFSWQLLQATQLDLPAQRGEQHLYASHLKDNLRKVYSQAIASATTSIFLSTYTLSDPVIIKNLNAKALAGRAITVRVHKANNRSLRKKLNPAITLCEHPQRPGLYLQGLMHEKICIIDKALCLFGTANMTYPSLKIHDNLVLSLYDPPLAETFQKYCMQRDTIIGSNAATLILLPDKHSKGLWILLNALDGCKKKLFIAQFCFTHPIIAQKLIDMHKKGIAVTVTADGYTARGACKKCLQTLAEERLPIYLSQQKKLFHHKWAVIDDRTLIIGSANWTKAAFAKNQDYFIIINLNKKNIKKMRNVSNEILKTCQMH